MVEPRRMSGLIFLEAKRRPARLYQFFEGRRGRGVRRGIAEIEERQETSSRRQDDAGRVDPGMTMRAAQIPRLRRAGRQDVDRDENA